MVATRWYVLCSAPDYSAIIRKRKKSFFDANKNFSAAWLGASGSQSLAKIAMMRFFSATYFMTTYSEKNFSFLVALA